MKVCFRVDASVPIGGGHVMRCLTLAYEMNDAGWECLFACASASSDVIPALLHSGFEIIDIPAPEKGDQVGLLQTACPGGVDLLIVDHYGLDYHFESSCRPWARQIMAIDDLSNRKHDVDVLLDQTYGRSCEDYRSLVPEHALILSGAKYSLLRREFAALRSQALARRRENAECVEHILIAFGTSDPDNMTGMVLSALQMIGYVGHIDIVLGSSAPCLDSVRNQIEGVANARLLTDVSNMADLMLQADLSIGAGGTTSWERCCLGLPAMTVTIAENQQLLNRNLARAQAIIDLGWYADLDINILASQVFDLINNTEKLMKMSCNASEICDGRGSIRTLLAILGSEDTPRAEAITLRLLELEDETLTYEWQHQDGVRRYFRTSTPPDEETHNKWFLNRINDMESLSMIIQCAGEPAGLIRLDKNSNNITEVSVLISKAFWGRGIATTAIAMARKLRANTELWAEINPANQASLNAFKNAGFIASNEINWYRAPALECISCEH